MRKKRCSWSYSCAAEYKASITLYLTFNQAATLKEKEAALLLLS